MIIAAYAVDCHLAFIYIRGEFTLGYRVLEKALEEARAKGFLGAGIFGSNFDLEIILHSGAGAYICGEETGLARIAGREARTSAAEAAVSRPSSGLYGCPTVVNNVETLANLPHIFNEGVDWFKSIGSDEKNTGPKLYCVSGHVNKPAVIERELGVPLPELIYDVCGGVRNGNKLKGVIPGGLRFRF